MAKFDTSFNFGANAAKREKSGRKGGGGGKAKSNLKGASLSPSPGAREWTGKKGLTLYFGGGGS